MKKCRNFVLSLFVCLFVCSFICLLLCLHRGGTGLVWYGSLLFGVLGLDRKQGNGDRKTCYAPGRDFSEILKTRGSRPRIYVIDDVLKGCLQCVP